jgi:hypothetical protein
MLERLRSPGVSRALVWVSGLILLAGVVAFVTVRLASVDDANEAAPPPAVDQPVDTQPPAAKPAKLTDVPKAARVTAGQWIVAAVAREDLPKAWQLTHPDLRAQCGCSYKEWLTGNIPVTPFPGLGSVSYAVDELKPRQVYLEVLLVPEPGSVSADQGAQAFFLGLKANGEGQKKTWLVDYWAPSTAPPIPLNPQG